MSRVSILNGSTKLLVPVASLVTLYSTVFFLWLPLVILWITYRSFHKRVTPIQSKLCQALTLDPATGMCLCLNVAEPPRLMKLFRQTTFM